VSTPEPCGAIRIVRWFEGMAQVEAWCSRTEGPCPYPGAGQNLTRNGRLCVVDFARLNPLLVSTDYHEKGHGGMFPEWCEKCDEETQLPPAAPLYAPDMLAEEVKP